MRICRVCGGSRLASFEAREAFLGTWEKFEYQLCAACGTRQIADVPHDLSSLYPPTYYDWMAPVTTEMVRSLERVAGMCEVRSALDIGCARGAMPAQLARMGIAAVGVDPFSPVSPSDAHAQGWTLTRSLDDVHGAFDMVYAFHVLEHVEDVRATLRACAALLAPGGRVLVAMPFDSPLAERYGPHWIGLDPGRHLHVLTRRMFVELAREAGLEVVATEDQTLPLNLLVSEAWAEGISWVDLASRRLSPALLDRYGREAAAIRRRGEGDAWLYVLRRSAA